MTTGWPRRRDGALAILVFAAVAAATLAPALNAPGWPFSHEGPAFAQRTQIYARHLSWLDVLPVWSSADAYGFGSPLPLFYHKLFYMLAGALALLTGSLKAADAIAVWLLLTIGAAGTYRAMLAVGGSRLAAAVAGCCLIAANYTVTNWLVRGALAEFSAAMVIPWVLVSFIKTIQSGRLTIGLGVWMGVLWLGHSVLAYYTGLVLAVTYLTLGIFGLSSPSVFRPRTAWPAISVFALIVGPYLVSMAILGRGYDFSRILTPPFQPAFQFRPFGAYLWERQWHWGRTVSGLTVQLDHAMLALLAASLFALLLRTAGAAGRERWRAMRDAGDDLKIHAAPVTAMLIVAATGLVLQLPISERIYEIVPGAAYIQFPWRLLALITPSLILVAVFLADRTLPPEGRLFALGAAAGWMLAACGAFAPLQDPRLPLTGDLGNVSFSGFREYEPTSAHPVADTRAKLKARWDEAGCAVDNLDADGEVPVARIRTVCGRAASLPLPLYASRLHAVSTPLLPRPQRCLALPEFPALCGAVVPAGEAIVSVKLPTMASVVRLALTPASRRTRRP